MPSNTSGAETRNRLLEAAAEVFAEYGYRHAKIQEICHRAQANVAAVNYHFGDKERLYMAVIEYAVDPAVARLPHLCMDPRKSPEDRLREFIHAFMSSILETGQPTWYGRLMAHATADPTPALDLLIEKVIRPIDEALVKIVTDLMGPEATADRVALCVSSIFSQCVLYHHFKEIIVRMDPTQILHPGTVQRLAGHITDFSLAGIRALTPPPKPSRKRKSTGIRN